MKACVLGFLSERDSLKAKSTHGYFNYATHHPTLITTYSPPADCTATKYSAAVEQDRFGSVKCRRSYIAEGLTVTQTIIFRENGLLIFS